MDVLQSPPTVSQHRPAVPPKPDKAISPSLAAEKQTIGTQVNLLKKNIPEKRGTQNRNGELSHNENRKSVIEENSGQNPNSSPGQSPSYASESPKSPPKGKPPSPGSPNVAKPALPPKPVSSSILSPKKIVSVISPSQVKPKANLFSSIHPVVRGFNTNSNNSAINSSSQQSFLSRINKNSNNSTTNNSNKVSAAPSVDNNVDELDGLNELNSNTSFSSRTTENKNIISHLPPTGAASEPVSPRHSKFSNPRGSLHFFHFPLFSPSTPSTQPGSTPTPKKIGEIKAKSASLGRNVAPPTSLLSSVALQKSITLQRVSPLDLSISQPFNKFMSNTASDLRSPIHHFGRSISFAPESPLPPPPPPRQKKKQLSPIPQGLPPVWPPPVPPPIPSKPSSPPQLLRPIAPFPDIPPPIPKHANAQATYAKIDKEKKWAMRKLKQEKQDFVKAENVSSISDDIKCTSEQLNESESERRYATIGEVLASSNISQEKDKEKCNASGVIHKDKDSSRETNTASESSKDSDAQESVKEKGNEMDSSGDGGWLSKYLPDPVCSINKENRGVGGYNNNDENDSDSNVCTFSLKINTTQTPRLSSVQRKDNSTITGHENSNGNDDSRFTMNVNNSPNEVSKIQLAQDIEKEDDHYDDVDIEDDEDLDDNQSFLFCHKVAVDNNKIKITTQTTQKNGNDGSAADENEGEINSAIRKEVLSSTRDNSDVLTKSSVEESIPDAEYLSTRNNENQSIETNDDSMRDSVEGNGSFLYSSGKHLIQLESEKLVQSCELYDSKGKMSPKHDQQVLLNEVDEKIQNAVSILSSLSGRSTPQGAGGTEDVLSISKQDELLKIKSTENIPQVSTELKDADLVSEIINHRFFTQGNLEDRASEGTIPPPVSPSNFNKETQGKGGTLTAAVETNSLTRTDSFRRRSWNCEDGSPSPSESSSSTSSIHLRGRPSASKLRSTNSWIWVDEGEISTGALGDGESSDALGKSSLEDIGSGKGSVSKRRRLVNSIFGSFGKGGSSSGSSIRTPGSKKTKLRSQFFVEQTAEGSSPRLGLKNHHRQISEILVTSSKIALPPTPATAGVLPGTSNPFQNYDRPHVQFSAEIVSNPTTIHSPKSTCPSITDTDDTKSTKSENRLSMTFSEEGSIQSQIDADKGDTETESCSSSDAGASTTGSSSSIYNDIIMELAPQDKKVFYVAREIMTSERTFVNVLNLLTIDFVNFVKNESFGYQSIISDADMANILGGLPTLKQVNEELLKDLEERIANWRENPKVSDIIVRKGPFLKHYSTYIRDFERIMKDLDICCLRYPAFASTVRKFETSERCQKLNLKHFMLKPVQRMPQYRLLLEDYLKTLGENSEDYEDTVKAITIVRGVAEHADEAIRQQVSAEKLMHLQNRLPNVIILKTNRQLLKEGELLKVCRKQLQPRFFALMNDCLLCMMYNPSAPAKDLKLRYELPLAGMRVSLTVTEDYQNEFSVISVARSFHLVAKSAREREDWMKALNTAINNNIKVRSCSTPDQEIGVKIGKEAPVWIQDSRVTMCQVCTGEFTLTFRRHHCRACGKVVCGPCSGSQAPLQYQHNKAARVCDDCYQYLLEEFDKENRHKSSSDVETIRARFKKVTPNVAARGSKHKRPIPQRLEVQANNTGSRMSGYLTWKRERKSWKRHWFVLMDRVLYLYAASEDIVAIRSIPILGWTVHTESIEIDGVDSECIFKLTHSGQDPIVFQTETPSSAEKWVAAMKEATVLT